MISIFKAYYDIYEFNGELLKRCIFLDEENNASLNNGQEMNAVDFLQKDLAEDQTLYDFAEGEDSV